MTPTGPPTAIRSACGRAGSTSTRASSGPRRVASCARWTPASAPSAPASVVRWIEYFAPDCVAEEEVCDGTDNDLRRRDGRGRRLPHPRGHRDRRAGHGSRPPKTCSNRGSPTPSRSATFRGPRRTRTPLPSTPWASSRTSPRPRRKRQLPGRREQPERAPPPPARDGWASSCAAGAEEVVPRRR